MDGRNGKTITLFFECDVSLGLDLLSGELGFAKDQRQRHGETGSMRSPDQFLWIRARLALETAGKPIGVVIQRAALGRNSALAVLNAALPFDRSECRRHRFLLFRLSAAC